jgi:hypothetical protein
MGVSLVRLTPKLKAVAIGLFCTTLFLLAFQNCSRIRFNAVDTKNLGSALDSGFDPNLPSCSSLAVTGITTEQSCNCSVTDFLEVGSRNVVGKFLYNMQESDFCAAAKHVGVLRENQESTINLKIGVPCQYFYGESRNGVTSKDLIANSPAATFYFRNNDNICSPSPIASNDVTCSGGTMTWTSGEGVSCSGVVGAHVGSDNYVSTAILDNDYSNNSAVGGAYFICQRNDNTGSTGSWLPVTNIPAYNAFCSLNPSLPKCNQAFSGQTFADASQLYGANLCNGGVTVNNQVNITANGWTWTCQGQGANANLQESCSATRLVTVGSVCAAPAGSYCDAGTIIVKTCQAGFYCTGGPSEPVPCLASSNCPAGSFTEGSVSYRWNESGWGGCTPTTSWTYSNTTACSATCGGGNQNIIYSCVPAGQKSQTVDCRRSSDNLVVADSFCASAGVKPLLTQSCTSTTCLGSDQSRNQSCNTQVCPGSQTFSESGTFVIPPGVTSLVVTVKGGGGGGGSGGWCTCPMPQTYGSACKCGGGGGCSGGVTTYTMTVSPGYNYSYIVGRGGAGGSAAASSAANGNIGSSGENSSFGGSSYIVALGGGGGSGSVVSSSTGAPGCTTPPPGGNAGGIGGVGPGVPWGIGLGGSGDNYGGSTGGYFREEPFDPGGNGGSGSVTVSW